MNKRKLESVIKALSFISTHKGTASRSFIGVHFDFDAPEYKRCPFQTSTMNYLTDHGLVNVDLEKGTVEVSEAGKLTLYAYQKYGMNRQ